MLESEYFYVEIILTILGLRLKEMIVPDVPNFHDRVRSTIELRGRHGAFEELVAENDRMIRTPELNNGEQLSGIGSRSTSALIYFLACKAYRRLGANIHGLAAHTEKNLSRASVYLSLPEESVWKKLLSRSRNGKDYGSEILSTQTEFYESIWLSTDRAYLP